MDHNTAYLFGPLKLIPARRVLLNGEEHVQVGSRAFDLLVHLVTHAGETIPPHILLKEVWTNVVVDPGSLRVHISLLRKALGTAGCSHYVQNVPHLGYCFVAEVQTVASPPESPSVELRLTRSFEVVEAALPLTASATSSKSLAPLLVGRESSIKEVEERLRQWRCVTLVGPGGIGKTSVALAASARLSADFTDGVVFLDLAPVLDPTHIPTALTAQLGLLNDPYDPMRAIFQKLWGRKVLLVVDSCEHLIETVAPLIESLLIESDHLQILATSREPLRISGEAVVRLQPLALPAADAEDSAEARNCAAVQLFALRASQADGAFELSESGVRLVVDICRRLDGNPLAIELAAANKPTFSLEQISSHLDQRLSLLVHGRRTALPRHQTLRATIDWSYRLLSPPEQDVLARLSLFRGWFSFDAAATVAIPEGEQFAEQTVGSATFSECLHSLISKSMLIMEVVEQTVQYRLLESNRAFAREQLDASGMLFETAHRHASYLIDVFDIPSNERDSRPASFWIANFSQHTDDLHAALAWALEGENSPSLCISLLSLSAPLWFARSSIAEFLTYVERAMELDLGASTADPLQLIRLYDAMGHAFWLVRGDVTKMTAAFTQARLLAQQHELQAHELRAVLGLWLGRVTAADYAGCRQLAERSGELFPVEGSFDQQVLHGRMMTLGLHLAGAHSQAMGHGLKALEFPRAISPMSLNTGIQCDNRIASLAILARIHWVQGRADTARDYAHEAVKLSTELGHALSTCFAVALGAGPVAFWSGDIGFVRRCIDLLISASTQQSFRLWLNFGLAYDLAASLKEGAHAFDTSTLEKLRQLVSVSTLLEHTVSTFTSNLTFFDVERAASPELDSWCAPELLRLRVLHSWTAGEPSALRAMPLLPMLEQSVQLAQRQKALAWELRATSTMAELLIAQGRTAEAADRLFAVLEQMKEGGGTTDVQRAQAQLTNLQQL